MNISKFYEENIKTYNSISESWDEKRNYYWKPVKNFLEKIREKEKKTFLDVSCGNGRHIKLAEKIGFKKNNIYGTDISIKQLEKIKEKNPDYSLFLLDMRNIIKIQEKTTFKKFDIIINIASFHHILTLEEQKKVLEQHKKILSEKGKILLSIWNPEKNFIKKMEEKKKFKRITNKIYEVKYTVKENFENKSYKRYYYFFEKEEIKKIVEEYFKIKNFYREEHNYYLELEQN